MKKWLLFLILYSTCCIQNGKSQTPNWNWGKAFGSANTDYGNSIATDISVNIYITGSFEGTVDFDPGIGTFNLTAVGYDDLFICKLNSSGNFVWAKAMGGAWSLAEGYSLTVSASGYVFTT